MESISKTTPRPQGRKSDASATSVPFFSTLFSRLSKKVFGGKIRLMGPVIQSKVNDFLISWNQSLDRAADPLWQEVPGLYSAMGLLFDPNATNNVQFQNNYGYPLKIFRNKETGELRMFDARRFT